MGFLSKKATIDELEAENERLGIETQVMDKRSHIAERKAVIKQLEQQYGGGWAKMLGISGKADTSTLRSFLVGSKKGMMGMQVGHKAMGGKGPASAIVSEGTKKKLWGNFGQ